MFNFSNLTTEHSGLAFVFKKKTGFFLRIPTSDIEHENRLC